MKNKSAFTPVLFIQRFPHPGIGKPPRAGLSAGVLDQSKGACALADEMGNVLVTERLALRRMTEADFPALCEMLYDPQVMKAYEGPFSEGEAREWLNRQIARYAQWGFGLWAVVLRANGKMIGQCGVTWQATPQGDALEVGYLFSREYWHQGYATEAARASRDYAFEQLGAREICSIIRDTNAASQAVARRNGMKPRLRFIKDYRGVEMPHTAFFMERREWEREKGKNSPG